MALPNISVPKIKTSDKDLKAYLRLPVPEDGEHYTVGYLHEVLMLNQISYGIDEEQIKGIVEDEVYEEDVLIATGHAPIDGVDGYYEYMFNQNSEKKPQILPDGSVDYWSMYSIQSVKKGQVIAIYHPAIAGIDGTDVFGKPVPAKNGREQTPLRGSGFEKAEDNVTYVSSLDGKIETQDGKIRILTIYEMSGDLNLTQGNVDFSGDIVIHGGVESGVSIKATGSITIDGVVEACCLEAGKDIIIRKGMIGGNKAFIKTKGNVFAKFAEYTSIEADGNIEADVLLDCDVLCKGSITLQGKRASIIGGNVRAVQGVRATNIGNDAETKTAVSVGAGSENVSRLKILQKKTEITREELDKIEGGLKKFEQMEKERGVSYKEDPRRLALLRARIKDTATLAGDEAEIKKLERLISSGRNATVCVTRQIYPGCIISIRDEKLNVSNNAKAVEFYYLDGKIKTRAATEER